MIALTSCASLDIKPGQAPHYVYLGSSAAAIGTSGATDDNERLASEMAEGVGWWVTFRGVEHLLAEAVGRPLKWWERALFWVLPTIVNVRRVVDNLQGPMQ